MSHGREYYRARGYVLPPIFGGYSKILNFHHWCPQFKPRPQIFMPSPAYARNLLEYINTEDILPYEFFIRFS